LNNWKEQALQLFMAGTSKREISRKLDVPYSSLWEWLDKNVEGKEAVIDDSAHDLFVSDAKIKPVITDPTKQGPTIIFLPDAQVKPGVDLTYLRCQGEYIAHKKPDVIVCAGDFADMESLSSYDKGKKSAEGKRVAKDIEAAIAGMNALLSPVRKAQAQDSEWKPRMVLTLGNHEERVHRHIEANPELHGFLSYDSLRYKEFGWEVYDYLVPVVIGGVMFIHYYPNPFTGKPLGGSAANILQKVGASVVQGHKQTLDVATRTLHNGVQQWSIVAGASYDFDEDYKGFTGNKHHRGIVVMHNVENGGFDPLFINIEYLKKRFA
jgi:hypothetical protein